MYLDQNILLNIEIFKNLINIIKNKKYLNTNKRVLYQILKLKNTILLINTDKTINNYKNEIRKK